MLPFPCKLIIKVFVSGHITFSFFTALGSGAATETTVTSSSLPDEITITSVGGVAGGTGDVKGSIIENRSMHSDSSELSLVADSDDEISYVHNNNKILRTEKENNAD